MSFEAIPLPVLAKKLDTYTGHEFQAALRILRSQSYVNQQLLKSDLSFLVAKILKLLRSSDDYQLWKGCHVAAVICSHNPLVLCSQANQLLAVIYNRLEQKAGYYSETISTPQGKAVLTSLVSTLSLIIDLVRGKPSLTREALTPKLSAIIPMLISLAQFEPKLSLPVLKKLLYKNTTTFKPHVNKFRGVLTNLITKDYQHFDNSTKRLICDSFAYLHLLKQTAQVNDENQAHHKPFPDEQWRSGLFSVLFQFKPVIMLCEEILDFDSDTELRNLLKELPSAPSNTNSENLLSALNVDMNKPITLWALVERLSILVDLLTSFISLPTPFTIRVPLGGIIKISEAVLSLTTNYLPLKRGLRRDIELTSVIRNILPRMQHQGVKLLNVVTNTYGKCVLPYLPSILGSLELFIPLQQKSSAIDYSKCDSIKQEFFDLLKLVNALSAHMGHCINEVTIFTKLVDVSLYLLQDKTSLDSMFANLNVNVGAKQISKKQKKDARATTGSMSDLYSHPQSFISQSSLKWYTVVNEFLSIVLFQWKLPSTQQVSIIKYAVGTSLILKEELGHVPQSFVLLLRTLVLFPGAERVSILPIAVTILKECGDEVFNVLCNPRLPTGIVQTIRTEQLPEEYDEETNEESYHQDHEQTTESTSFETSATITASSTATKFEIVEQTVEQDESKVFKKRSSEEFVEEQLDVKRSRKDGIEEPDFQVPEKHSTLEVNLTKEPVNEDAIKNSDAVSREKVVDESEDEDDSEFEIPDIQISDDED